ncbi:MAG TPA: tetratricopeptide repeat protein [Terriglobia bacterium]|nr:tetratricopeptide repeat protein [Terriglobia bacterium]
MKKGLLRIVVVFLCLVSAVRLSAQTTNRPEIEQHYQKAQAYLQAKQTAAAAQEFREILRLDPANASAHANLGVIAFDTNDYPQAAQEFRAALKLQPRLWNAEAFLGMTELRLGNTKEAKLRLEEAIRYVQDPTVRGRVATDLIALAYQSNDLNQAVDILRGLEKASPNDPATLYMAYRTYSDLAAQHLSRLEAAAPDSAEMHEVLGQLSASQDDFHEAIAQYRKALELNPGLPGIHFALGQMILANSTDEPSRQEAENELKLALASDPNNAECEYLMGEIEWLRSKPDEALKHYRRALVLRPGYEDAQIAAGKSLARLGDVEGALKYLSAAVAADPQSEAAHYQLSQIYRKLGRTQDAERESATFQKIRDSQPHFHALDQGSQPKPARPQTADPDEPR